MGFSEKKTWKKAKNWKSARVKCVLNGPKNHILKPKCKFFEKPNLVTLEDKKSDEHMEKEAKSTVLSGNISIC